MLAWICTAAAMAITAARGTVIEPKDPYAYKIVSLNSYCDSKDHKESLNDTSATLSAGILTATQLRDLRGTGENGCSFEFSTPGSSGLIVSVIEMNLRMGVLNESCIDYISSGELGPVGQSVDGWAMRILVDWFLLGANKVITKFNFGSDKDERCGRITKEQNYHFTTPHSLQLKLFSKTPLTNFFEDNILAVVATSYTESQDGICGQDEFQCTAGDRCIYKGYRCDNVNNCGDNSDEAPLGNSMCLMPFSSLVLIIAGLADLLLTWCIVLCCCLRSALTKQKALQEDRWGALAPEDAEDLSEEDEEDAEGDDQDDDGGTGDASTSSQRDKGNAFRNPLAASLRSKEDERDDQAATATEAAS